MGRVKYPLTPDGQSLAEELVRAWDSGELSQMFVIQETLAGKGIIEYVVSAVESNEYRQLDYPAPHRNLISELAHYGMLSMETTGEREWEYLLLQELRNAVASDFEVSDYFLTFNAVGTIVSGDLVVHPGGNFQSGASTAGDVNLTNDQVIEKVESILGTEFLENQPALAEAISSLQQVDRSNSQSRMGRVISELGRCLEHTANFAGVIAAIQFISGVLR